MLQGSGSWAVNTACERDKWTISSKTGQILVGAKFYLRPSWGLLEAAVPEREEPLGGDRLGADEPRLPSPRAGNVRRWEPDASAPKAGRREALGSVFSSAHEHLLVLCSGARKPAVTVGPRKFNAQNHPLVKGTTWGPVASEGCTGHGTRGSAASQWLDPTRVAARVVQTPRRPAGFCVMTAPFVSQQEVGTEGGGHRPRLLAVHGPHGPRLAIREVGGTGRTWNFGSHHVALKEVVQNVACLAVRMADQPLDPHGPPSPCSASEVHTKGHPREQPQHPLSKSLSPLPGFAVPPPAPLGQARVHCPPAQVPLLLPQPQDIVIAGRLWQGCGHHCKLASSRGDSTQGSRGGGRGPKKPQRACHPIILRHEGHIRSLIHRALTDRCLWGLARATFAPRSRCPSRECAQGRVGHYTCLQRCALGHIGFGEGERKFSVSQRHPGEPVVRTEFDSDLGDGC